MCDDVVVGSVYRGYRSHYGALVRLLAWQTIIRELPVCDKKGTKGWYFIRVSTFPC